MLTRMSLLLGISIWHILNASELVDQINLLHRYNCRDCTTAHVVQRTRKPSALHRMMGRFTRDALLLRMHDSRFGTGELDLSAVHQLACCTLKCQSAAPTDRTRVCSPEGCERKSGMAHRNMRSRG
ncbi:hypothetical protein C7974DRAFT_111858 [Boeremia exigua]|uniref:uncharacterized protein n=1 Tax=Boeremia exigua TaxID=749465 RepID=UPI001E8CD20E|nr:uncharacterized protein C7974DRAFT_111858 [Boeremia exigua]KAH6642856.1 hypothetical protein C7974DRAFT_111858 [Boeremia exigua]